jgi:hypothetical protein
LFGWGRFFVPAYLSVSAAARGATMVVGGELDADAKRAVVQIGQSIGAARARPR